ncbi:sulfotransferase family 2 domain-containing protein [Litchfieldella rifensis]|uniref:Sulfotransferase family 2 domain-containing protein n=1 Tax=Litchfieldella rifensis TaxID=762643 RepID=A0ABV7LUV3_9GAMM
MSIVHKLRRQVSELDILKSVYLNSMRPLPVHLRYNINRALRSPYSTLEDENKIIFIHIPKTAGNAIMKSLYGAPATGHDYAMRYLKYDAEKFYSYYKFAVVRNPWDRLVSSFFYLKQGGMGFFDKDFANKYLSTIDSFDYFLDKMADDLKYREKILSWVHFVPQTKFICDPSGNVLVDEVLKIENIDDAFGDLKIKLGKQSASLIRHNDSKRDSYKFYYNNKGVDVVQYIYTQDVNRLGYEF